MESSSRELHLYQCTELIASAFAKGAKFRLDVIGESMAPTLKAGNVVVLEEPKSLKKGDIILYKVSDETFNLHRIRKMTSPIQVVGDNNVIVERVDSEQVIAKVDFYIRGDKNIKVGGFADRCYRLRASIRRLARRVKNKVTK